MFESAKGKQPSKGKGRYDRKREAVGKQQRSMAERGREIGPIPEVADPKRREKCRDDLERALITYFPGRFKIRFSADHKKAIARIEQAIRGELIRALAMPRSYGKTTLSECAVALAILYCFHLYAALLAATQRDGQKRLQSIRKELETNPILAADFPEIIYPIQRLEGITQRSKGQLAGGEPTSMEFGKSRIILPTTPGNPASGAVIECGGLLSAVRGMNYTADDGTVRRPTFVMVDDPQTRRSARSETQTEERETILAGDVMYLAGPDQRISGLIPCTVIEEDDLADRILDRDKHPEFNGLRTKMLYEWPAKMDRWDTYAEQLNEELRDGGDGTAATRWYRRHKKQMDAGAKVAWPENIPTGLASALEHAMRLYYRNPESFASEAQNEPSSRYSGATEILDADNIAKKTNEYRRGELAKDADRLTAFVDVQKECLFWLTAAWSDQFTGYVIDYGAWPEQKTRYFHTHTLRRTLSKQYRGMGLEARLLHGLKDLDQHLKDRTWTRPDGAELQIDRALVDANWGDSTESVYRFCRQCKVPFLPAHGKGLGAGQMPYHLHKKQAGDRIGEHWKMPSPKGRRASRYVLTDTNFWKSFVHHRLTVPLGDPGSLSLFAATPKDHRLIADHLTAEYPTPTAGPWGQLDEWKLKTNRENHLLDCLVGAAAAASIAGCRLKMNFDADQSQPKRKRRKKRVSYV